MILAVSKTGQDGAKASRRDAMIPMKLVEIKQDERKLVIKECNNLRSNENPSSPSCKLAELKSVNDEAVRWKQGLQEK
jgi:hypothetical protein